MYRHAHEIASASLMHATAVRPIIIDILPVELVHSNGAFKLCRIVTLKMVQERDGTDDWQIDS